jgi:uncharacterized protein
MTALNFLGIPLLGLVIGFLVGLTGLGGGALMTPALILLVHLEPRVAVGTDLIYASLTKMLGSWQHIRLGNVNWQLVLFLALGSVPGAFVGTLLLIHLDNLHLPVNALLQRLLGFVLVLVALTTLWKTHGRKPEPSVEVAEIKTRRRWVIVVGFVVGLLVSLTSIGSGTIVTLFLLLCFSLSVPRIVGTDLTHAVVLLTFAGLTHFMQGQADLHVAGLMLVGSLPGVLLGTHFTGRLPEPAVKTALAALLLFSGLRLL